MDEISTIQRASREVVGSLFVSRNILSTNNDTDAGLLAAVDNLIDSSFYLRS